MLQQTETAFLNILPTFVEAHSNLPTSTSKHVCLHCVWWCVNVCMCNLISAHGRRLLSVSVCMCAHPNPTNSHPGMITDQYRVSHTHPEGRAPVDHHTTVAFEVPASLLLSPTLEADSQDLYYSAFNMT